MWGGSVNDNCLYMLNFTENAWQEMITTGTPPPNRQDFPYFLQGEYFYILIGLTPSLSVYSPGCYRISLETLVWECLEWDLEQMPFAYTIYSTYLILLGGIIPPQFMTNEMLIGEIATQTSFLEISPYWNYPKARLKHSLQTTREYLWLFGGYSQGV